MPDSGRAQDIKVGVFVLAALLILIVGSLWIVGSSSLGGERVSYQVLMKDSRGVEAGDRVRLAGVKVGRIQSVTLNSEDEWPVRLEIGVRAEIPVRENSSAVMATNGLLGSSFLQLVPGTPDSPLLPPGGTIHGGAAGGMEGALARVEDLADSVVGVLEQTSGLLDQVSTELRPIMTGFQDLLSEKNVGEIHAVLASLHAILDEVSPRVGPLLDRLEAVSQKAESGLEGVPQLTDQVSALLADISTAFGPEGSRLTGLLETAQSSLTSADEVLSILEENRGEIEATVRDLRSTVANLKAFSESVRQRPSSLIRNSPAPDRRPGEGVEGNRR